MKILGLDSSGIVASVAIVEDENLIAAYTVNYKKTHSQTLLSMLDELVKMTELDLDTIDAIAVAAGPGSYRTSYRFCYSQGTWSCVEKATGGNSYCGCTGI